MSFTHLAYLNLIATHYKHHAHQHGWATPWLRNAVGHKSTRVWYSRDSLYNGEFRNLNQCIVYHIQLHQGPVKHVATWLNPDLKESEELRIKLRESESMCWRPQTLRCLKSPTWKTDQGVFCQSILIFCGKPVALGPGEALRNRPVLWTVDLDSRYEVLCNNFKTWSNHWRFGSNYKGMTVWSTKIVSLRGLQVLAFFSLNDTTQWQSTWQSFRPWWHRWRGCRGWGRAGQGSNWKGLGMLQLKPIFLNAWTHSENRKTSTWDQYDVCDFKW